MLIASLFNFKTLSIMEEQLVTLETAKLAENKKFNLVCRSYSGDNTPLPTQALLQKWLREKHKTEININYCGYTMTYCYETIKDRVLYDLCTSTESNTYEEALEKALEKSLTLI